MQWFNQTGVKYGASSKSSKEENGSIQFDFDLFDIGPNEGNQGGDSLDGSSGENTNGFAAQGQGGATNNTNQSIFPGDGKRPLVIY